MKTQVHILWYKRDLRLHDHPAFEAAAHAGTMLPLYIVEPSLLHAPDLAPSHWTFLQQSLFQLREKLAVLGQPLVVRVGEVTDVLEALMQEVAILALWSHEETGNALTYRRDLAVAHWAKAHALPWHEIPQSGVVRRLKSRESRATS